MASAVSALSSASNSSTNSAASALGATAPSEEMFLQLLVAQLQNQDPLNPTDSTQFVSQLAQFSELEQVMGIKSDADTLVTQGQTAAANTPAAAPGATPGQTTASTQTKL